MVAQPAENSIRWVSPRGTIDVLDDYAYHVAVKMGYFGDIETTLEPGPIEATAGTKAVDTGQADVAYPSPGVYSLMIEQGSPLISVFEMGAYDVFDFAFPKGKALASVKDLEGKTVALGSAGWQGICNPEIAQAGGDPTKVNYVDAGPQWGQTLAQGQADSALSWAGLRAQWAAIGLDFDYILGKDWSKFPANSYVIRRSDFEDAALADIYGRYFRGWAQGLEFGYHNPVAATQITFEAQPALNEVFEDKQIAVESMWQLAEVFRGDWAEREGLGLAFRRGLGPLPQDHLRHRTAQQGADGRRRAEQRLGGGRQRLRSRRGQGSGDRLRADRGLRLAEAAGRRRRVANVKERSGRAGRGDSRPASSPVELRHRTWK